MDRAGVPKTLAGARAGLSSPNYLARHASVLGLRDLGSIKDIPLVRPLLNDSDDLVRESAVWTLHKWSLQLPARERSALDADIMRSAYTLYPNDPGKPISIGRAERLARLGDASRYQVILDGLTDKLHRSGALMAARTFVTMKVHDASGKPVDWATPIVAAVKEMGSDNLAWAYGIFDLVDIGTPEAVDGLRKLAPFAPDRARRRSIEREISAFETGQRPIKAS